MVTAKARDFICDTVVLLDFFCCSGMVELVTCSMGKVVI